MARELIALKKSELPLATVGDAAESLKTIAVAEAAEKMFARAKDGTGLYAAVETKLGEQRRFVLWWDGLGDKRGRPKMSQTGDVLPIAGKDGLPDRDMLLRWRKEYAPMLGRA